MKKIDVQQCPVCIQSKMHRTAFKSWTSHRAKKSGQIIHLDVGSFEVVVSRERYKYYVTFVDDFSKFLSVFPMKSKSHVFLCFKLFHATFEKDRRFSILSLWSDNGRDYISSKFSKYLSKAEISHKPGPPHSPELNGVAERTNRTIGNLLQCALLNAKLPKAFWANALWHLLFTINSVLCLTPSGFISPNSLLKIPLANLKYTHPFGCLAWYKVPEAGRKKLDSKGCPALLLSHLQDGNGY
jgi:transposase InsO family protein